MSSWLDTLAGFEDRQVTQETFETEKDYPKQPEPMGDIEGSAVRQVSQSFCNDCIGNVLVSKEICLEGEQRHTLNSDGTKRQNDNETWYLDEERCTHEERDLGGAIVKSINPELKYNYEWST